MSSNTVKSNVERKKAKRRQRNKNRDLSGLPDDAVIRLPDVLRIYPVSASHWWDGIKRGVYPKPVKLGERARGWKLGSVLALTATDDSQELS